MKISLKNAKTNEIKEIKVGWSWTLFFFSGCFGIPLFLRKLYALGGFMFLATGSISILSSSDDGSGTQIGLALFVNIATSAMAIYLGVNGNKITGLNLLNQGWVFTDETSENVKIAKSKWGISA